ncbi:hypothetical protein [Bosea sp. RAC05]|uniref:hypothetical protein n=1 Tax=Bosea sp. RAC05 TaxID=1842539 RepID=UPI00083CF10D|nr:hypothetical protein [Bosea sp. RAC05]AOG03273.1 putative membrane protein [Bosea sp. RAC05]
MAAHDTPVAPESEEKLDGLALLSGLMALATFSWTVVPMLALGVFAAIGLAFGEIELVLGVGGLIKQHAWAVAGSLGLMSVASAMAVCFVAGATR